MNLDRHILRSMLEYGRPADSATEEDFLGRFVLNLPNATIDPFGNVHVTIGDSPILWSCHTDTADYAESRRTIHVDPRSDVISLSRRSKRNKAVRCLGADDTAGVFLLRALILAGKAGHYVFHRSEEIGGLGSDFIATETAEVLAPYRFAIALDRRGTGDIITHQAGGRCSSDAFARSLAVQLNANGLQYAPSALGSFTDTANYTDHIGECTNLSVGYRNEHTTAETLDLAHVNRLYGALLAVDPDKLESERKPGDREPIRSWRGFNWPIVGKSEPVEPYRYRYHRQTIDHLDSVDCAYCGRPYFWEQSNADDPERYCCMSCETADGHGRPSTYLDPAMAYFARWR